jgi:alpha-galactosidase
MTDKIYLRDRLILDPARGTFDFVFHAQTLLQNATAAATYRDARGHTHHIMLAGNQVAYGLAENRVNVSRNDDNVELVWSAMLLGDETYLTLELVNRSREPIRVDALHVLSLDAAHGARVNLASPPKDWRFYQNGWQSWSATFVRAVSDGVHTDPATEEYRLKHLPHAIPATPRTLSSEWFTVLAGSRQPAAGSPAVLLSFVTTADQLSEIRLQLDGDTFARLDAIAYADGVRVEPGERLVSEKLLVAFDDNPLALLERYAARLGETMRARGLRAGTSPAPTGWCTWYYFFGQNTERDVIANVERIRAERLPLDVVIIDDGYQTSDGDWTSVDAEKFPRGMRWLADEIKRAGLTPALWVAPFAANENSQLAREHPEFLLHDEAGAPVCAWRHWGERCFSLDLSRTDVQNWLREMFCTLSDDWGYEFFKLDFIYTAAAPGVRSDPRMTRAQALRRGLEIIREVVGDKILLGCGAPLGTSVGLVDAMRIGPDVDVNWEPLLRGDLTAPATAHALRNTLARTFMHNHLWQNDPDCVLVRPRKGRGVYDRRDDESALVLNEMRTLVSLIGLSGGAVISSDNLPSLRRGRLKYLKQILPPTGRAARALDLFDHELPQLFALPVQTDWGEWLVVGVVNWDDKTAQTEIALETLGLDSQREYHVYNYWHRRYVGIVCERVRITRHQPHETRVLLFKPVSDRVELLTTTFHVAQGLVEVKCVERGQGGREAGEQSGREDGETGRQGDMEMGRGGDGETRRRRDTGTGRGTETEIVRVEFEKKGVQQGDVLFAIPKGRRVIATRVDGRKSPHRFVDKGIVAVGLTLDERAVVEVEVSAGG